MSPTYLSDGTYGKTPCGRLARHAVCLIVGPETCPLSKPAVLIMKLHRGIALFCVVTLLAADRLGAAPAWAAEPDAVEAPVVVRLASGRKLQGDIAPQTNAATLWLLNQRAGISVSRPIEWDHVVTARVVGSEFTGEQLRQAIAALRQAKTPVATAAAEQR